MNLTRDRRGDVGIAAALATFVGLAAVGLSGGGVAGAQPDSPSLVGQWTPSDGTALKVFDGGGACKGFFYDSRTGKPLDIGGPMSCAQSSKVDSSGRYRLAVTQGPNSATYLVEFTGADTATVYSRQGKKLYSLVRF